MVLVNLLRLPGLSQQELAKRCLVAKSRISMRVTRMVGEGLLKREADATDARVRRLRLTPAGPTLARQAQKVQAGVVLAMTEGTSVAELRAVEDVMQRVAGRLEALREKADPGDVVCAGGVACQRDRTSPDKLQAFANANTRAISATCR